MAEITKSYDPRDVEKKWYAVWRQANAFAPRAAAPGEPESETCTIVIPPPNVTGILHMGHALNNTLQDVIIRRARLEGKAARWIPGTDHAGIATQTMVEKHLKKTEGKTRYDLGRDEFLKRVWAWRDEKGDHILNQLRQLGCSCDWERTHFTMDPGYSRAVLTAFVDLFRKDHIYRGKRMVNWCPASLTALSDEEVEMRPTKGHIYRCRYELVEPVELFSISDSRFSIEGAVAPAGESARQRPIENPLPPEALSTWNNTTVAAPPADAATPAAGASAPQSKIENRKSKILITHIVLETTRPETIAADVAVAVHPDDPRYRHLVGRKVWRPLGARVQIPVIADAAVDPVFAAGALKVTPAHDKVDFEIGQRHALPVIDSINADGTMNAEAGPELAGLDRFAARKKAAAILEERGNLIEAKPYENNVGYSQRAGVPIEPRLTWQWWLRYPRVEEAKQVVRDGIIQMHPERWSKVYLNWLENIQDWCISRQLWWGHRIPVWYRKGIDRDTLSPADLRDPQKIHVSLDGPADPENWTQEDDVLDTWASSWLWPFATQGWPDEAAMKAAGYDRFYPTTTLATGADIIFFWVARMIMAGLEFTHPGAPVEKRVPFKHVYFNGIVRDKQGRKMSKTLGNSPDPLDLVEKYGADGLRFGLLQIAPLGQDVKFDEDRIEGGKNFCNKLWNACRFRQMSGPMADNTTLAAILARIAPAQLDDDDHALLGALLDTMRVLERAFAEFEFATATQRLYSFFWNDFCDWYVEVAKTRVQDPAAKTHALAIQDLVIREFLLLFAPFAPFITEELWHLLGYAPDGNGAPGSADMSGFSLRSEPVRVPAADTALLQDTRIETADTLAAALAKAGVSVDPAAGASVEKLKQTATLARQLKAEQSAAQKRDVKFLVLADPANWAALSASSAKLARLIGAADIERAGTEPALPAVVTPLGTFYLDTGVKVDPAAERARLAKELAQLEKHIAGTESRLANKAFTDKAPAAVIEGAKKQLADQQAKRAEIERLLNAL
ncbi:valine--tRNA ligase [Termitidicoccus mucosus]|uniref:Valine--tRNA ligase n=1 Tax=Termitidicoccus mucosus TaxID=1184151 RepID=A0A178IED4_9BACT|nr:valine--tRNA ligase [Opitutaceae bacterium TSB47]